MTTAVLLNHISDADHFVQNRSVMATEDAIVLSTHVSVDVYLRAKYNIECTCLSRFLTAEEVRDNIRLADSVANELAIHLDQRYSAALNERLNLKGLRFFWALYSYAIYIHYMNYVNLIQALVKAQDEKRFGRLLSYDTSLNALFDNSLNLVNLLESLRALPFAVSPVSTGEAPVQAFDGKSRSLRFQFSEIIPEMLRLSRAATSPRLVYRKLRDLGRRTQEAALDSLSSAFGRRKRIMVAHPLYDLEFLPQALRKKYNLINFPEGGRAWSDSNAFPPDGPVERADWAIGLNDSIVHYAEDSDQGIKAFVLKQIQEDFNNNIFSYVEVLRQLSSEHQSNPFSLAIWGNSPILGLKSIVTEYLLSQGVPVLGCQHGGLLGNLHNSDVYLSDASRCTDYITYGFTKEDLRITYPDVQFDVKIHALGSTKKAVHHGTREKFDILFPITNSVSMFDGSMLREKPDEITEKQIKILEFLKSLRQHRVMVKPFLGSDYESLAIKPLLDEPGHLTVRDDLSLMDALAGYDYRAVIMEHVSTPVYECLPFDMEIFVANDPVVRPIETTALEELKRRVYYYEDVASLIRDVTLFLDGKLPRKRDDSFYRHHVWKENAEENILRLVDHLVQRGPAVKARDDSNAMQS